MGARIVDMTMMKHPREDIGSELNIGGRESGVDSKTRRANDEWQINGMHSKQDLK